jgi:hypothetical protein
LVTQAKSTYLWDFFGHEIPRLKSKETHKFNFSRKERKWSTFFEENISTHKMTFEIQWFLLSLGLPIELVRIIIDLYPNMEEAHTSFLPFVP